MGFAQGFAAGSAAVERGRALSEAKRKREEEEQYKAQMAGLVKEYQTSQEAGAAYDERAQGALAAGAPVASAVAQPQYSPEAQRAFGLGGAEPMMSSVATPQVSGLAAGDQAGVMMGERPQAMSGLDMQQRAANIALGAGRFDDYMAAQNAIAAQEAQQQRLSMEERRLGLQEGADKRSQALFDINIEEARARRQLTQWGLEDEKKVRGFSTALQTATKTAAERGELFTIGDAMQLDAYKNLNLEQQQAVVQDYTGRSIAEQQAVSAQISNMIKGKSFDQLLQEHKDNKYLTPGQHFEKEFVTDKDGNEQFAGLRLVNDDGTPAGELVKLGSESQALQYLNKASLDPVIGAEFADSIATAASSAMMKARELGVKVEANNIAQQRLLVDAMDKADAEIAERAKMGKMAQGDINEVYSRYLGAAGGYTSSSAGLGGETSAAGGGKTDWPAGGEVEKMIDDAISASDNYTPPKKYQGSLDTIFGEPMRGIADAYSSMASGVNLRTALDRNIVEGRPLTNISNEQLAQAIETMEGDRKAAAISELQRRQSASQGLGQRGM
jgi:hypothetical protein